MAKKPVKYYVVDAFTESAFKGNPAAVCLLEEEDQRDEKWFQLVAAEFNISTTCYLTQLTRSDSPTPHFRIRWFSPVAEVILPSGQAVKELQPQFDAIRKCPGRGIIISGVAPLGSGFDYYYRYFGPKFGINEDPVTGSANCALTPYWSKKLGKCDLIAYAASPRGGVLNIHLDEQNQTVLLRGKAITVMEGSLLV